jgi:ferritin heavy chain
MTDSAHKSGADHARKIVQDISDKDIDEMVKISSFTHEVEQAIREHVNLEYKSWYTYKKLASDCARSNIALHGFSLFFARSSAECFADASYLEKYLIQRGGVAKPGDIPAPTISWPDNPIDPVRPLQEALHVERSILEDAQRLCDVADKYKDYALQEIIESRFLQKETKHVKDMGDLLKEAARISKVPGHGLYHLDKDLRVSCGKLPWGHYNNPESAELVLKDVAA